MSEPTERDDSRRGNFVLWMRRGTTVIYSVRDTGLFELLDVARRIFNGDLADTIDLLRLVEAEPELPPPTPG